MDADRNGIDPYSMYEADFTPTRTDDLRAEVRSLIGRRVIFEGGWMMEDDEQFPGERVLIIHGQGRGAGLWVPFCDVSNIRKMTDDEKREARRARLDRPLLSTNPVDK